MEDKKQQIVQTALRRFAHYGFSKTTMSEIAADMGITKANLYYYYPDKNALMKDVLAHMSDRINGQEMAIVRRYDGDLLETIDRLLQLRADYVREYYVLHISESLEWIKGEGVRDVVKSFHQRDIDVVEALFASAARAGEVVLEDAGRAAAVFVEILRGLSLIREAADLLTGMPTPDRVDDIVRSQREAARFIFANKMVANGQLTVDN